MESDSTWLFAINVKFAENSSLTLTLALTLLPLHYKYSLNDVNFIFAASDMTMKSIESATKVSKALEDRKNDQ